MQLPPPPPKAVSIEVVAVQPTDADSAVIAHLSARESKALQPVTYLVKIQLEVLPQATSQGWTLYVNHFRIPKYWAYKNGIYFKIFDPQFFHEHHGQSLRFSRNAVDFIDTGLKMAVPDLSGRQAAALPLQDDVL
jgi:hypothetical protein